MATLFAYEDGNRRCVRSVGFRWTHEIQVQFRRNSMRMLTLFNSHPPSGHPRVVLVCYFPAGNSLIALRTKQPQAGSKKQFQTLVGVAQCPKSTPLVLVVKSQPTAGAPPLVLKPESLVVNACRFSRLNKKRDLNSWE